MLQTPDTVMHPCGGPCARDTDHVRNCERAWVVMDPDAQPEANRLADQIGRAARVIHLPFKIDAEEYYA